MLQISTSLTLEVKRYKLVHHLLKNFKNIVYSRK